MGILAGQERIQAGKPRGIMPRGYYNFEVLQALDGSDKHPGCPFIVFNLTPRVGEGAAMEFYQRVDITAESESGEDFRNANLRSFVRFAEVVGHDLFDAESSIEADAIGKKGVVFLEYRSGISPRTQKPYEINDIPNAMYFKEGEAVPKLAARAALQAPPASPD